MTTAVELRTAAPLPSPPRLPPLPPSPRRRPPLTPLSLCPLVPCRQARAAGGAGSPREQRRSRPGQRPEGAGSARKREAAPGLPRWSGPGTGESRRGPVYPFFRPKSPSEVTLGAAGLPFPPLPVVLLFWGRLRALPLCFYPPICRSRPVLPFL